MYCIELKEKNWSLKKKKCLTENILVCLVTRIKSKWVFLQFGHFPPTRFTQRRRQTHTQHLKFKNFLFVFEENNLEFI
jgi:hypothetical protein